MRNEFLITDTQNVTVTPPHFSFSLYSAQYIEQYLNTILHCSNKSCENDKYVFLLQGRLTIIFCTLSCFVCSLCLLVFTVLFLCFLLHIKTKFPALSKEGRRLARSQGEEAVRLCKQRHKDKDYWRLTETFAPEGAKGEFMLLFRGFPLVCPQQM